MPDHPDSIFYVPDRWNDGAGEEMRPPGYYFWDETWAYAYGPYATYREAHNALTESNAAIMAVWRVRSLDHPPPQEPQMTDDTTPHQESLFPELKNLTVTVQGVPTSLPTHIQITISGLPPSVTLHLDGIQGFNALAQVLADLWSDRSPVRVSYASNKKVPPAAE